MSCSADDEAERKKKKKTKLLGDKVGLAKVLQSNSGSKPIDNSKKTNIDKQISNASQSDRHFSSKEDVIKDTNEVCRSS